jgi:hypothetical protein
MRGNINIGKSKKLIKFIRATLMVDWLQDNYDFYGIFIIRNPLATINSQLKKKFFENIQEEGLENYHPPKVIKYFNKEQQKIIKSVKTPKNRLIVNWCMHNRIALDVSDRNSVRFIKYEDLIDSPESVIRELSEFAHFPYTHKVRKMLYKKSFTTRKNTKNPRIDWRNNFTKEEIDSAIKIVKAFELDNFLDL